MILTLLLITLITFVIFVYVVNEKTRKRLEKKYKDIPKPGRPYPIVGNVFSFKSVDMLALQTKFLSVFDEFGHTYMIHCSWQNVIITSCPKVIEEILSSTNQYMSKNVLYDLLRPWLKEGLLLSEKRKWHSRRKIITPAFHFKILESFVPVFERHGDQLIDTIKQINLKEDDILDISELIGKFTLNTIAETSMGINPDDDSIYTEAVKEMSHTIATRFIRFYWRISFLCFFFRNDLFTKYNKLLKILHECTEKTIIERRDLLERTLKETGENLNEIDEFGQKKRMVFLDVLLQSTIDGKPLTNSDIQEEVDTFMFEGHDTTSASLCFTLCAIARHPEIQNKLFKEIIEVIGNDKTKPISYRDLQELKYLELVIKESLRLYPSVPVIGRIISTDSMIDGKLFPAGAHIVLYLQQLMRNPDIFDKPNEFIPERHLQKDFHEHNSFSYVPFSAGPRNCVGQKYAMLELKSVITKVLRNFELLPNGEDVVPIINVILKSTTGFNIGFKERKYN